MNPMMLARMLGLSSPLGVAANVGSLYPMLKDDDASAASRHAHGEALRATMRDSFNADRQRQGLPPLQLGPPTQGSLLPPQAVQPPQAPQAQPASAPTALPPLPTVNIPSIPQPPASVMNTPPQGQQAMAQGAPTSMQPPQAPQDDSSFRIPFLDKLPGMLGLDTHATGPELIQKFISALHGAGPGVDAPDRHAINGW